MDILSVIAGILLGLVLFVYFFARPRTIDDMDNGDHGFVVLNGLFDNVAANGQVFRSQAKALRWVKANQNGLNFFGYRVVEIVKIGDTVEAVEQ